MKLSLRFPLVTTLVLLLGGPLQAAEERLTITDWATGREAPIRITLSGYSGEALNVLQFDLEVAGFKVVPEAEAQWLLQGSSQGQLQGRLTDAINKSVKFSKAYSGGSLRNQVHTLADEVVEAAAGRKGIARTRIAFKVKTGEAGGAGEIYVSDYDGFNAVAVTQDRTIVAAPSWIPGRRGLVYMTHKFNNPDIVYHDLGTGERKVVARYAGSSMSPAVSPDGRRVAMILGKSGNPDLYVANLDGTGLKQLTQTREDESSPCWSPDGKFICFATRQGARRVLARIPADGGTVERIPISNVGNPTEPDWSPDGKWIAFTSQAGNNFDICVIPARGGEARILVGGEDPAWAPNSRTLVFTKRLGSRRVLSLLDVPTRQNKDARGNLGSCSQPSWAR
ncbi:MAG: PD40 domain-containing protein [Verrucomicrobia bacterium]|nr:PD40 domain-containing protein [Verrucomicrobiota bacterium]